MQVLAKSSIPCARYGKSLWCPRSAVWVLPRLQPPQIVAASCYRGESGSETLDTTVSPATTTIYPRDETPSQPLAAPAPVHSSSVTEAIGVPTTPSPSSPPPQPAGFLARRLLVFSGLVLGYAAYYLTRNSLTYAAPVMVADPTLGFSLAQVGAMTSIFPIAYGMSKFVSGVLGDHFSPTLLLGGGLMLTAACNLALGAGHGLTWFAALWALNGLLQGVGAPSCARMLTSWFASRERGTYWGLWNIAHNMGGFLSPLVAATAAQAAGWRWGMWAPGLAGMALGLYVLLFCRDTPQDAGFNPVETTSKQPAKTSKAGSGSGSGSSTDGNVVATGSSHNGSKQPSVLRTAIDNVLSNPYIWALALTYFCVYVVRQGVTSWTVFYLINEKGVPDAAQAAMRVSGLELGGLLGGLAAGHLSDSLIRKSSGTTAEKQGGGSSRSNGNGNGKVNPTPASGGATSEGSVGKRVQVVMAYTAALAAALTAFQALPASAPPALQWLSVAAIGFCIYGPQMLIGLCGAELVHPGSVGASQGVLGWVAYLGAANAGVPLSWIITSYGWTAYFTALTAACGVALLLLTPLMRLPSFTQRQQQQQQQDLLKAASPGNGAPLPKLA
ncbi:hypothetical protein VaNZ11_009794 [Volvox africanus]|uniref:Major facilitator superfamily (MFS) profile domain-containing protein n=1 Tax=Volvox africanus TaxID=51714 RepID=A0ABQ5S829_9CHLO|nr:hypothetical protein VaNZ11_009794 [Volvox africanus]